jgi:hypothetical protein
LPVHAGAVDERVDAAEQPGELVDLISGARQLREIELPNLRTAPVAADLLGSRERTLLVAMPGDADVEPVPRELHGGRLADPGVGTGDDRNRHNGAVSAGAPRKRSYARSASISPAAAFACRPISGNRSAGTRCCGPQTLTIATGRSRSFNTAADAP